MKVANSVLIAEQLSEGCFLEFDFLTKCYLVDSDFNRLYAVRFDTFLNFSMNMSSFYRNKRVHMTDSKYYKYD